MTGPNLLLPLRIPELGPYLGRLVTGTGRAPAGLPLDAIRQRLVTRVFASAGEARRLAARDDRAAAAAAVGPATWLEAWEEAVSGVADRLADRVNQRLDAEARAVRMPRRVRRRLLLDAPERRALIARLATAGAPLVAALDALDRASGPARNATALERGVLEQWQTALRGASQRLEAAWLALEEAAAVEAAHWEHVANDVVRWRRSLWPVILVGALGVAVAAWVGLVMGGYLEPPPWFVRWWGSVWGS